MTLLLRAAVACRTVDIAGIAYHYLSLNDHEIDGRAAAFVARMTVGGVAAAALRTIGFCLEPADAVIAAGLDQIVCWKGGACGIPLFWSRGKSGVFLATHLPHPSETGLSRVGLMGSFATVTASLQNDPNLVLHSPVAGWKRVRRGAATRWSRFGTGPDNDEVAIDFALMELPASRFRHYEGIVEELRVQMQRFGEAQVGNGNGIVELSGGMDSTLAAWSVLRQGGSLSGVSISFPFYEFRFEDAIQIETARALGLERIAVDGRDLYAYAPCATRLPLDEPAVLSMISRREQSFARIARERGAHTVYVGEGGDQLLSEHLFEPMSIDDQLDTGALQPQVRAVFREVLRDMHAAPPDYLKRSTLAFSYDARLAPAVKEVWGVTTRTPFTDLGMVLCGIAYARWCVEHGFNEGKKIVAEAFSDVLPGAIMRRRGKVSWEGVYARTYQAHEDALGTEFESCQDTLEKIGFDVGWLMRRVRALGRLEITDYGRADREVMSAYALASWLNEKGIQRATAVSILG